MANDNLQNPNENLKNALKRTGLTPEEFADIVEVDVKTVQRWIAGRTPTPRHQAKVAAALDTSEHALWPDTDTTPSPPPPPVR
jgi:transcriptional regulator with XRE-family HTH domain